jgi:stage II sporulation protein M
LHHSVPSRRSAVNAPLLWRLSAVSAVLTIVGMAPWIWQLATEGSPSIRWIPPFRKPEGISLLTLCATNLLAGAFVASGRWTYESTTIVGLLVIGYAIGKSVVNAVGVGVPISYVLVAIGPHGVLEMPALWLAGAVGLTGIRRAFEEEYAISSYERRRLLLCGVGVVVLVVGAAIVEVTATPALVSSLFGLYVLEQP